MAKVNVFEISTRSRLRTKGTLNGMKGRDFSSRGSSATQSSSLGNDKPVVALAVIISLGGRRGRRVSEFPRESIARLAPDRLGHIFEFRCCGQEGCALLEFVSRQTLASDSLSSTIPGPGVSGPELVNLSDISTSCPAWSAFSPFRPVLAAVAVSLSLIDG